MVAVIYFIIDLHRQGAEKIPDIATCTDKLQMWHVRKPLSDEPLLFSDINFVKHDPFKTTKKELCSSVKYHNPVPHFANKVRKTQLEKLVKLYEANGLNLPIIQTIKSNNFEPVLPKGQSMATDLNEMLFDKVEETTYNDEIRDIDENSKCFYERVITCDVKAKLVEKTPDAEQERYLVRTARIQTNSFNVRNIL